MSAGAVAGGVFSGWLPRVRRGQPGFMDFVACVSREQLRPGPFGLVEPEADLPGFGPEDVAAGAGRAHSTEGGAAFAPSLMVLPGLAFDLEGGRLVADRPTGRFFEAPADDPLPPEAVQFLKGELPWTP